MYCIFKIKEQYLKQNLFPFVRIVETSQLHLVPLVLLHPNVSAVFFHVVQIVLDLYFSFLDFSMKEERFM